MEMGLTLLAQSGLSPKHWVDAFLTAIFLINRLPSPVLKNESPFSKLFKKSPDYTNLRTFGCLCYPLLRPYATHKLSLGVNPASSLAMVVINVATDVLTLKLTKFTSLDMLFSMKLSFQPRVCLSHKAPARSLPFQVTL